MARDIPTAYNDPFWTGLAASTEKKLGIPDGLLVSILVNGEKTNADRVSSAGAKSPFQIIPATREGAIKKWGIDPDLSPENAAEVAGLVLNDSLKRNQGDVEQAVGEYHGGLDRKQWGSVNAAYRQRVMAGLQSSQPEQSTYARLKQAQTAPASDSVSQVYDAYQSGRMTPEDAATFEQAVGSGQIMLPRGAKLKSQSSAPTPMPGDSPVQLAPQGVADAYVNGTMAPADRAQLEQWMRDGIVKLPASTTSQIPGEGDWVAPTEQGIITPARERTLGEKLAGLGEAALALGTGAAGGAAGTVTGSLGQAAREALAGQFGTPAAANRIEQAGQIAARNLTYSPRTDAGQEYTQSAAEFMGRNLAPFGAAAGEAAILGQAAKAMAPSARAAATITTGRAQQAGQAVGAGVQRAGQAVASAPGRVAESFGGGRQGPTAAYTGGPRQQAGQGAGSGSLGSAATPMETVRYERAKDMPVEVPMTVGQITRDPEILAFEKEQIKGPEGQPLRDRAEAANMALIRNVEALFDMTDANAKGLVEAGGKVQEALLQGHEAAKTKTRVMYQKANSSPEAAAVVDTATPVTVVGDPARGIADMTSTPIDFLNDTVSGLQTTKLATHAKAWAKKLGIAIEDPADGKLIPNQNVTVKQMMDWRREISQGTGFEPTDIRDATVLKRLIDAQTEPFEGPLFRAARAARAQQAMKFENRAVVARLVQDVKGMADPRVAADQVFQKSIVSASPEEITFLKRVLHTVGDDGKQAWKEMQGAMLREIERRMTNNNTMDSNGNPVVSSAQLSKTVREFDNNGRLDIVLGKKQAAIVRDLSTIAQEITTVPPGTLVNASGTAGTIMRAIAEAGATGAVTGIPVPVISILKGLRDQVKSAKLRAAIKRTLDYQPPNPSAP